MNKVACCVGNCVTLWTVGCLGPGREWAQEAQGAFTWCLSHFQVPWLVARPRMLPTFTCMQARCIAATITPCAVAGPCFNIKWRRLHPSPHPTSRRALNFAKDTPHRAHWWQCLAQCSHARRRRLLVVICSEARSAMRPALRSSPPSRLARLTAQLAHAA